MFYIRTSPGFLIFNPGEDRREGPPPVEKPPALRARLQPGALAQPGPLAAREEGRPRTLSQ